jgi:hypothetical protein
LAKTSVDFGSPEELAELLETIGLKLHAGNRIGGGESGYLWHLAETIRKTGRLATLATNDPNLEELYGNGYEAGSIAHDDQRDHFMSLLKEQTTEED